MTALATGGPVTTDTGPATVMVGEDGVPYFIGGTDEQQLERLHAWNAPADIIQPVQQRITTRQCRNRVNAAWICGAITPNEYAIAQTLTPGWTGTPDELLDAARAAAA